MGRPRPRLSLKGRALQLLAQRDQSRVELRRKLLRHAANKARAAADGPALPQASNDDHDHDHEDDGERRLAEIEALLDWLEANRFLSAERFVESRVHAREARFGNLRIKGELARHGLSLTAGAARSLAESELRRAIEICSRKYPEAPTSAEEMARRVRFLSARGFSPENVRRALREIAASALAGEPPPS
jgi:regulatory protein